MSVDVARMNCRTCGETTKHERQVKDPSHVVHFLLTLMTLGLWGFVWLFVTLFPDKGKWRCADCGTKAKLRDRLRKS